MLNKSRLPTIVALGLLIAGCGGNEPAQPGGDSMQPAAMTRTPATPGAAVFIITPTNGSTVTSPVTVKFGISGMTVASAGQYTADSGHHHLLINTALEDESIPVPSDSGHLHFGKGQTETTLELEPGQHTLQLVLGDGNHVPHDPPVMSDTVTITVE